jgi:hypothetical protein
LVLAHPGRVIRGSQSQVGEHACTSDHPRRDRQRVTMNDSAVGQLEPGQPVVDDLQGHDLAVHHADAASRQLLRLRVVRRHRVAEVGDVGAQLAEHQCLVH